MHLIAWSDSINSMNHTVIAMNEAKKQPGVNQGGAPKKITPQLLKKAKAFCDGEWRNYNKTIPTIEGLAKHLSLYRSYIYEVEELSDTREWINQNQGLGLIEGGLDNTFNPSIVKLLLSKHGYVEKSQTDVTSNGETIGKVDQTVAANFAEWAKANSVEGELVEPKTLPSGDESPNV